MIPPVVASERGTAQTVDVSRRLRGCRTATLYANREQNTLENVTIDGDDRPGPAAGHLSGRARSAGAKKAHLCRGDGGAGPLGHPGHGAGGADSGGTEICLALFQNGDDPGALSHRHWPPPPRAPLSGQAAVCRPAPPGQEGAAVHRHRRPPSRIAKRSPCSIATG